MITVFLQQKYANQSLPQQVMHQWSMEGPRCQASSRLLPVGSWMVLPPLGYDVWQTQSAANQRSSPKSRNPKFLLGFHYVGMIDWILAHVVELTLQPLLLWGDQGDITLKVQPVNGWSFWCDQSPSWVFSLAQTTTMSHLVSINYQAWSEGLPWVTRPLQFLGKFQGFGG